MSSRKYTWDQMYLDEYAKGKALFHGREPDEFVVWAAKYLKEKGVNRAVILDAGCGEGRNCVYLAKQGFVMHGVDIALPPIEKGRKWIKLEGLAKAVDLRVGDVTNLPYKDSFFDAVIDIFTIEFIPKRKQYIEEVARVLKPNGYFFIKAHKPPVKHSISLEILKESFEEKFEILYSNPADNDVLKVVAKRIGI